MPKYDYLVIDVGSTFTKQRLFKDGRLVATVQSPTTVKNVYEGIDLGRKKMIEQLGVEKIQVDEILASSSAAGGLRMVAMGYMIRVTAKAAKEVAMNSGSKILEIISNENLPDYRVQILKEINPDIILLAGGTDFGDETSIIENAHLIVESGVSSFVVVAGNVKAQATVAGILREGEISYIRVPNIMPTIHELRVKESRDAIHREFIRQITKAKGLRMLQEELTTDKVIPTPGAVLLGAEILAKGVYSHEGIGDCVIIDLGGATTDVHSVIPHLENLENEEIGLIVNNEKQVSFRTVEGNLGMRVSAKGILETVNPMEIFKKNGLKDMDLLERFMNYVDRIDENPELVASDEEEYMFDTLLAKTAVEVALKRHAGYISQNVDPVRGIVPGMPVGRDLRYVKTIIGVGGIFAHRSAESGEEIIKSALVNPGVSLLPKEAKVIIDQNYLLFTSGVIAQLNENYGFEVLKNEFKI